MCYWLSGSVKLQQQLCVQQRLLSDQERQIKAQQQEIEQLKEERDKLKNRSSQNSSVPPSSDLLKKPILNNFEGNGYPSHGSIIAETG